MQIPAFLCIDVEPDEFALPKRGPASWAGYDDMIRFTSELRSALGTAGASPRFVWALRMDPQVAAVCGRADYVVDAFSNHMAMLSDAGDVFGLHVHPLRWSEHQGTWFHEFSDREWLADCAEASFATFADVFRTPPAIHRFGAQFLSNELVALAERLGAQVDLTLEPGHGNPYRATKDVPMTGKCPNWIHSPRVPYRPLQRDYREIDNRNGRGIVMMPLTAARTRLDKPWWWRTARAVRRGGRRPLPLYLTREWPSSQYFWDLVAAELDSMRTPYLALAVRTDHPGSVLARRARELLEHLPHHPLARRLRFLDPLGEAPALVSTS